MLPDEIKMKKNSESVYQKIVQLSRCKFSELQVLCNFMLTKLTKWTFRGDLYRISKSIVIMASHTSYWDVAYMGMDNDIMFFEWYKGTAYIR